VACARRVRRRWRAGANSPRWRARRVGGEEKAVARGEREEGRAVARSRGKVEGERVRGWVCESSVKKN